MNFEEFESKARLYVLGALDTEELEEFEQLRERLGDEAERIIADCHRLNAAFALSLRPTPPRPTSREKLLSLIEETMKRSKNGQPTPATSQSRTAVPKERESEENRTV